MDFSISSFGDVAVKITDFVRDHGATLPAVTYAAIAGMSPSPVDRAVFAAEALYAAGDHIPDAGKMLAAQLAQFCVINGFHELGAGPRGPLMIKAIRRRLGELTEDQAPHGYDPLPNPDYVPPAEG